jgi:hypothetical protein
MDKRLLTTLLVVFFIGSAKCQMPQVDSTKQFNYIPFSSVGFNISSISAVGISYRKHFANPTTIQITGGFISTTGNTSSAIGAEVQFEISKKSSLRYYVSLGIGHYSFSSGQSTNIGLGIGIELPAFSETIFDNVTGGVSIFYPAAYFASSGTNVVTLGVSLFTCYNF